jgi:Zn finger protein HypA/HybF involved in hydrogenase expression
MHEASVAQAIFDAALAALPTPNAKIIRFAVVAGPFSGVEEECLRFYLTAMSAGTPAAGAELVVRCEPAKLICDSCGNVDLFDGKTPVRFSCAKCASPNRLEGGHDLYLDNIEVE